jgi:hypothetical protein
MSTYRIVRFIFNGDNRTILHGLSLEEAQEYCSDPETSGKTAKGKAAQRFSATHGTMWFDGYEEE